METSYKLAVIGSRGLINVDISYYVQKLPQKPTAIISGGAKGIDTLAESFAAAHNLPTEIYKPDYKAHAQGAPIRRNESIVKACDAVLALWDGKSRGTKYTIEYAKKHNKPVFLFMF